MNLQYENTQNREDLMAVEINLPSREETDDSCYGMIDYRKEEQ